MMKFTSIVGCCVLSLAFLSGCSSLFVVNETEPSVTNTEAAKELLTPLEIKVNALQTQPNLYLVQASKHKFDTQTLRQFQDALALKKQGNFTQAREQLIALSEQHPDFSGIWLQLALLAKELNKDDIALQLKEMSKYLNTAITANPLNYQAQNELALVLRQQGKFQQALNHYELALKSWPSFATAYFNRAILYDLYMGEKSLALADYELYKALSNDDSRQLTGWIMDLQRQIKSAEQGEQTGGML